MARREQNLMNCEGKENKYKDVINETSEKIELENRVHAELENYIAESIIVSFSKKVHIQNVANK